MKMWKGDATDDVVDASDDDIISSDAPVEDMHEITICHTEDVAENARTIKAVI